MERRMSKPRLMAVVGAMLAALLISAVALAQNPPHTFFGFSGNTTVDGEAADGATVSAWVDGAEVGSATLDASGEWSIEVDGGTMGVSFSVNGMAAEGSYDANPGGSTSVTLAVTTPVEEPEGDLEGDDGAMEGDDGAMEGDDGAMEGDDGAMEGDDGAMEGDDGAMEGDDGAMEGDDDAMEGDDDAMDGDDDAMDGDDDAMEPEGGGFGNAGTGGLADSSGSNSWAFGLAGALALTALLGGVAIRRRVQS